MTKPKIPNQKKKNEELEKRLAKYSLLIEQIYDTLNREAAKAVGRTDYTADAEEPFRWSDYPETKKQIDGIQAQFVDDIGSTIYRSTSEEWQKSNAVQDLLATKVLRAYNAEVNGKKYKHFFQTNSAALKAFQKRKDRGMNLSARLWKQADEYKCSLEAAISCAIEKGTSAVTLSKQISRYLVNFPELQKDYKERFGRATDVHDCEYNSMRLARTEINMAYREAENERWRQMEFVVGYEIKVSNNHGCKGVPKGQYHDICDELAGKYPKDFKWTGWHPQCRCYKIPILMTEDEFWEWDGRGEEPSGSVNEIKDVPDNFKRWAEKNSSRIAAAKKRGTLPYFVRDNEKTVERVIRNINRAEKTTSPLTEEDKIRRRLIKDEAKKSIRGVEMSNLYYGHPITISSKGINEWLNQPFSEYMVKNEALLKIPQIINGSQYLGWGIDRHDPGMKMHLFETMIGNTKSWIIVRETYRGKNFIYSISDQPSILQFLTHKKKT